MDWLWAGGIIGALTACWGHIRSAWAHLSSLVVVQVVVQGTVVDAVLVFLQDNCWPLRIGPQTYTGGWMYVKPVNRVQLVAWRMLGKLGSIYFKGKKPLWVSLGQTKDSQESDRVDISPYSLKVSFIRGAFAADDFVYDAVAHFNRIRDDTESRTSSRHYIRRIYGLSKKRAFAREGEQPRPREDECKNEDYLVYRNAIPLGYNWEDIGVQTDHTLDTLALSPSAEEAVLEARRWKISERWYKKHGLPWRRGWLLYGQPGTGKTALVRALAEELDLPVYIYDLASLANDEFQSAWRQMLSSVPCIALIEDIDGVFDGRKTAVGDLTFDCLLNCLDGIERADGLFTIITTNNPGSLDPALGIADEVGRSTRPGRVDRVILMDCPDAQGRLKIAKRILTEYPSFWDGLVQEGEGETGAQFQESCAALALKLYWDKKRRTDGLGKKSGRGDARLEGGMI